MPLYEYRCLKCGEHFEEIRKFSDPPLIEHENCGGELRKLLSPPAIQFKGTGWYVTDYARKSVEPKDAEQNAKQSAGDTKTEKSDQDGKTGKTGKTKATSSDTKSASTSRRA